MLIVITTALLSSLFTCALLALLVKVVLLPKLRNYINDELLPDAQRRAQQTLLESADPLLPKIRENVSQGVTDALVDAASGGLLKRAPGQIADNLDNLSSILFGRKP
jgi:hypothetical protein